MSTLSLQHMLRIHETPILGIKQEPLDIQQVNMGLDLQEDSRLINPHPSNEMYNRYHLPMVNPHHSGMSNQRLYGDSGQDLQPYSIHTNGNMHLPPSPPHLGSISDMEMDIDQSSIKIKGNDGKLTIPSILSDSVSDFQSMDCSAGQRRARREFVPDNKKDDIYWKKRLKNNDSARRSRVKRKALEKLMESRLMDLQKENIHLRHELTALKRKYGIEDPNSTTDVKPGSSLDIVLTPPSPPPSLSPQKIGEEDLEAQSAGSDDSQGLDDARSYSLNSVSSLSYSFTNNHSSMSRPRADSSSSGNSYMSNGHNQFNQNLDLRTDKNGALDLTNSSDCSNRSTPDSQEEPRRYSTEIHEDSRRFSCESSDTGSQNNYCSEAKEMKSFPLKCRWKKEMLRSSISTEESM